MITYKIDIVGSISGVQGFRREGGVEGVMRVRTRIRIKIKTSCETSVETAIKVSESAITKPLSALMLE